MITVQRVAKAAGKHLTRTALKLRQALGANATLTSISTHHAARAIASDI